MFHGHAQQGCWDHNQFLKENYSHKIKKYPFCLPVTSQLSWRAFLELWAGNGLTSEDSGPVSHQSRSALTKWGLSCGLGLALQESQECAGYDCSAGCCCLCVTSCLSETPFLPGEPCVLPSTWVQPLTWSQTSGKGLQAELRQEAQCVCLSMGMHLRKHYCSAKVPQSARTLPLKHQKGFCEHKLPSHQPKPAQTAFQWAATRASTSLQPWPLLAVKVLMWYWQPLTGEIGQHSKPRKVAKLTYLFIFIIIITGDLVQSLLSPVGWHVGHTSRTQLCGSALPVCVWKRFFPLCSTSL